MKSDTLKHTKDILKANGVNNYSDISALKNNKKLMKKLKKTLKDIEVLRRMGGVTLIVAGDSVITTYHNNSINRKILMNKNKIKY